MVNVTIYIHIWHTYGSVMGFMDIYGWCSIICTTSTWCTWASQPLPGTTPPKSFASWTTFEPVVEPLKPLSHSPLHFRLLFPNPLKFSYPLTPKNYKGAYPNLYYTTKNKRFITKKAFLGNPVPNPTATFFLVLYLSENLFGCPSLLEGCFQKHLLPRCLCCLLCNKCSKPHKSSKTKVGSK